MLIHYRTLHGNTTDSMTHIDTWQMLSKVTGRVDFLYVADCKLCSKSKLAHIDKHQMRFITVLPRNRREDRWFRSYIQTHDPPWQEAVFRQEKRGWPGEKTRYLRKERMQSSVTAEIKDKVIVSDERSDGMFPLITNCKDLSLKGILEASKFQPRLEQLHKQLNSVEHLAPVWLKNVDRVEVLLFLYFIVLLVHDLLEREVQQGMAREGLECLPHNVFQAVPDCES